MSGDAKLNVGVRLTKWVAIGTALIAAAALVVAVIDLGKFTASRRDSARESCRLLKQLVLTATPPSRLPAAHALIAKTPLNDCNVYARTIVK